MAVGDYSTAFHPVPGVRLASVPCGIKGGGNPDLVLFEFAPGSVSAGIFTRSHFAAAPVLLAKRHLAASPSRYFLINSGNANAATGEPGISDATLCCEALSQQTGVRPEEVLPFSTGVIGERLQTGKITDALPRLLPQLDANNWLEAARGIMTTDTRPKIASRQFTVPSIAVPSVAVPSDKSDPRTITITGIGKGAGMIQPNMATLLVYLATDAAVSGDLLQTMLQAAADQSFNRITVDSDTSTNDACMLIATGASGLSIDEGVGADQSSNLQSASLREAFTGALTEVMIELAQGIVRDAEGATKFIEVSVQGGRQEADCLAVAYAIANSPLIKTAVYAGDANWGRIVMAIGKADVELDSSRVDVYLDDVCLLRAGARDPDYREELGAAVMQQDEIRITVNLNQGEAVATLWTSDLSHDYVSINSDYRS